VPKGINPLNLLISKGLSKIEILWEGENMTFFVSINNYLLTAVREESSFVDSNSSITRLCKPAQFETEVTWTIGIHHDFSFDIPSSPFSAGMTS
jgi:hypothetical protein